MIWREHFQSNSAAREELARARPRLFLLHEAARYAAVMALVLIIADVTPLSLHPDAPWRRLAFVVVWSLAMARWTLSRLRARRDQVESSFPPVI
jgi:hypothetical protein